MPSHKLRSVTPTELQFKFFRTVSKTEIPTPEHRGKPSVIRTLPFWPELESTLSLVEKEEMAPFEAIEVDLDNYKKELSSLKKPLLTVLSGMRKLVKQRKLDKKLEVRYRGNRIFLVGS